MACDRETVEVVACDRDTVRGVTCGRDMMGGWHVTGSQWDE